MSKPYVPYGTKRYREKSNAVILPPISRTTPVFKPTIVSVGGSKNRDSI